MNKLSCRVVAVAVLAAFAVPLRAEIIEQVLVKVNGDIITKTELENRQIAAIRQRMSQDVSPESLKNDAGDEVDTDQFESPIVSAQRPEHGTARTTSELFEKITGSPLSEEQFRELEGKFHAFRAEFSAVAELGS